MKTADYIKDLQGVYTTVGVLSDKNGATVYRLRNNEHGRDMVLKKHCEPIPVYDILKTLHHDNLPEIYDALTLEDGQIVLEEYVSGLTVAQVLESGRYTYGGARKVLFGVCAALMTLHSLGIIHRDIKPENIMITDGGGVKLIDFSAARQVRAGASADTAVLGTIGYASPEQMGIAQCDARADIYAMGVLLNVMLTGEHPSRHLTRGRAGAIVRRCTQIDPDSRYQSAEKLMRAL